MEQWGSNSWPLRSQPGKEQQRERQGLAKRSVWTTFTNSLLRLQQHRASPAFCVNYRLLKKKKPPTNDRPITMPVDTRESATAASVGRPNRRKKKAKTASRTPNPLIETGAIWTTRLTGMSTAPRKTGKGTESPSAVSK